MKLLKKLRLINWHYFTNVNVKFEDINFLTGENGSGKSTLIDALQVILLGDTSGRSFNKAANEKAGRTLKGYLRGEVGDDSEKGSKYLRNGRFSSYICLEFFDTVLNEPFTIGIVFDVFETGDEEHRFFYCEGGFPVNDYVRLGTPLTYKELHQSFIEEYGISKFVFLETNSQYQNLIKEKFGNIKQKYFSLFKKAVSFTPITNIEQFITEYVCDVPNEINIETMRANIQQYKRLEIEADSMQQKIVKLEAIHEQYLKYKEKKEELNLASFISKRITYQIHLDNISHLQSDIQGSKDRIVEIEKEIISIESRIKTLEKQKEGYIAEKVSSGAYRLTSDLQASKEKAEERIAEIENSLKSLRDNLSSYINNFMNVANKCVALLESDSISAYMSKFGDLSSKLLQSAKDLSASSLMMKETLSGNSIISDSAIIEFKEAITNFKNCAADLNSALKPELAKLISTNQYLKQQNSDSSTANKMYDYGLIQVRNQLRHALSDHYKKDIEVLIFADLVDVKTSLWANALEGYLYSQKIHLFVEPQYYLTASKILPEIMKRNHFYRTGLVDSEKLAERNFVKDRNSLAEELITNHQGAQDYINYLLGKIYKCQTIEEARESGRGITPQCYGYRNFASFMIPENNYQYALLGRQASKEGLKHKNEQIKENDSLIATYKSVQEVLAQIASFENLNNYEVQKAKEVLFDCASLDGLKANLNNYISELNNAGSLEVSTIELKISRIEEEVVSLQKDKESLTLEKGSALENIKNIEQEKIPQLLKDSSALLKELEETYDADFVRDVAMVRFNEELENSSSLPSIRVRYDDIYLKAQNKIRSIIAILNELRKEYVLEYKLSYDISKEDNNDFDNELTIIRDVKLPEYRIKIVDAYEKATKEFKDDFIFKLKTSIETVRSQIDELNEALKDAKFGQDSYQFVVTAAPQYREYYEMITDDLLLSYGDDEEVYNNKYQDIMSNLFKLIGDVSSSRDQNSLLEQNVAKFTDYRTYLYFDLMVKKGENKSYSLARNIKKASGGETQTPFYISMLASFTQLYRVNADQGLSNTVRLVVFDEAFSKMDSARIIESIRILKSFGLQVILSAPPEKVSELSRLVDRTLFVSRYANHSYVDEFEIVKA